MTEIELLADEILARRKRLSFEHAELEGEVVSFGKQFTAFLHPGDRVVFLKHSGVTIPEAQNCVLLRACEIVGYILHPKL